LLSSRREYIKPEGKVFDKKKKAPKDQRAFEETAKKVFQNVKNTTTTLGVFLFQGGGGLLWGKQHLNRPVSGRSDQGKTRGKGEERPFPWGEVPDKQRRPSVNEKKKKQGSKMLQKGDDKRGGEKWSAVRRGRLGNGGKAAARNPKMP